MRSWPSTTNRMSFASRASWSASRVSSRSSSSSSASRIVTDRASVLDSDIDLLRDGVFVLVGVRIHHDLLVPVDRQDDGERRALAGLAVGLDRPAVAVDDLAAQGQPDAGA